MHAKHYVSSDRQLAILTRQSPPRVRLQRHCLKLACPWCTLAPTAAIDIVSLRHDFSRASPLQLKCHLLTARRIGSTLSGENGSHTVLSRATRNHLQQTKTPQNRQQKVRPHPLMLPLLVTHPRDVNLTLS